MAIRRRVLPSGTVGFFADFRINGIRQRKLFATRKEADAFLVAQKGAVKRGEYIDPKTIPTFKRASDDLFAARQNRSPSTISGLRSRLACLTARLGDKRLDQIDVAMLEALRADLRKTLKRSTTRLITQSCGEVFKYAMRAGKCLKNPVALMEREHTGSREIVDGEELEDETEAVEKKDVPNRDAVREMIARAPSGFYRTILSVAAGSGLREGELLALKWANVELGGIGEPGKIDVKQTLSWARGSEQYQRAQFREPKTKAGIRTVAIPPELNAILRAWKLQAPPSDRDLVFSNDGLPHRNGKIGPRISKLTGVKIRLHALRHYFASAMIASGQATIVEIAKVLGHKDATVTLKVYAHFLNRDDAPTAAITAVSNGLFAVA
jgi:integrase